MRSLFVVALALAGCGYDWDVGPKATTDATTVDTGADTATNTAVDTSVVDAGSDTIDCAALLAEVVTLRANAKKCTPTAYVCEEVVTDECGCPSVTADPGTDTNLYANAAKRFRDAGCSSPACGPCQPVKTDFCLVAEGGGYACDGP